MCVIPFYNSAASTMGINFVFKELTYQGYFKYSDFILKIGEM